jgi:hypothetical protein
MFLPGVAPWRVSSKNTGYNHSIRNTLIKSKLSPSPPKKLVMKEMIRNIPIRIIRSIRYAKHLGVIPAGRSDKAIPSGVSTAYSVSSATVGVIDSDTALCTKLNKT